MKQKKPIHRKKKKKKKNGGENFCGLKLEKDLLNKIP